jgi:hypothetical protein
MCLGQILGGFIVAIFLSMLVATFFPSSPTFFGFSFCLAQPVYSDLQAFGRKCWTSHEEKRLVEKGLG